MTKETKTNVPAKVATYSDYDVVDKCRSELLKQRALARLEAAAEAVHAAATSVRGFQAVSSKDGFSAVIKHGRTLIEIQGEDFAIRQTD
jgi:hypothetical protein